MSAKKTKGNGNWTFPLHCGSESETYAFYRVPKVLFRSEVFDCLSTDAKILYGMLLDRMQLSAKNGWLDSDGSVFIYFPQQKVMEALNCGNKKAGLLLAELDDRNGIGLITRVRQGLGKPDRIYVRKCIVPEMPVRVNVRSGTRGSDVKSTFSEVSEGQVLKCQNDISGSVETTGQDMSKRPSNNTEYNKTEKSETDLIGSAPGLDPVTGGYIPAPRAVLKKSDGYEEESLPAEYEDYRRYFEQACCIDYLCRQNPRYQEIIGEILELLTDTCCTKKPVIRISGDDKPASVVRSMFMKLESGHIQYVLDCFEKNTTDVRNIKQYLLAALYNAPMTIGSYYTAQVNHEMYGSE